MTDVQDRLSRSFELLLATCEQVRQLAAVGEYEAALVEYAQQVEVISADVEFTLAKHSARGKLADALQITPQAVSKRYPGAFRS